jgi:hypothetical protein
LSVPTRDTYKQKKPQGAATFRDDAIITFPSTNKELEYFARYPNGPDSPYSAIQMTYDTSRR